MTIPDVLLDPRSAGREAWRDFAACAEVDPEAFFPEKGDGYAAARRICSGCPVAEQCLSWSLENDERDGMYGGMSPKQRAQLLGRRSR